MENKTKFISFIIFVVTFVQILMTLFIGFKPGTDPTEIYVRNYSSIAALLILGLFFNFYSCFHNPVNTKRMKTTSIILAIASIIKAVISAFYAAQYINPTNLVFFYYFGETLIWTAVCIFAISYHRRFRRKA